MCGRFTRFHTWSDIHQMYSLLRPEERGRNTEAHYNIAPTDPVEFVVNAGDGSYQVMEGMWWLVPLWAKEKPKYPMFNARSESADTKSSFRDAWQSRRCLIPASGFYEWTKSEDGGRDPWFIHLPETAPFSFAGLWARNSALDITSCTVLTMAAGKPVSQLHDRQPVILAEDAYDEWLDPKTPADDLKPLLNRNLDSELVFHRVGREVNKNTAEGRSLIAPIG